MRIRNQNAGLDRYLPDPHPYSPNQPPTTQSQQARAIFGLEDELLAEEMDPQDRAWHVPTKAMERLGHESFVVSGRHAPEILQRIRSIHKTLYRTRDIAGGGVHGGVFMFRGIAAAVHIPIVFGRVGINPFDHCDLLPRQIEWLQADAKQVEAYVATFCDLFDLAGCISSLADYEQPTGRARDLFGLAAFQLQGASASLCAAFDGRGAVQSALIGAELSLKGVLAEKGKSEAQLKSYRHDRPKLVRDVKELYPAFEARAVRASMQGLPELVPNRYSSDQPTRMETGGIVMASQFIAGAAARAVTGGSLRREMQMG